MRFKIFHVRSLSATVWLAAACLVAGAASAQVAPNAPVLCIDEQPCGPAGSAPYNLGSLPSEFGAPNWPAAPVIRSEVTVSNQSQLTSALAQNGVRIIVQAGRYGEITIGGSDKEIVFRPGAVLAPSGSTAISLQGPTRLVIRGGHGEGGMYGSGSPTDVLIDGLTLVTKMGASQWSDTIEIQGARRLAVINSNFSAYRYTSYIANSSDVIYANNVLEGAGPEATFRNTSNQRVIAVDNTLSNPQKHNFRVHVGSDLIYFARNRLIGSGIMVAQISDFEANRIWIQNNTLYHDTPSMIAVAAHPTVTRATVRDNTFYTTHCTSVSGCGQAGGIGTGPGWVVSNNPELPYRTPQ